MSVVAVKIYDDKIQIAADSIVCSGCTNINHAKKFSKLVEINDMIIGTVGTANEGSLMWLYMNTHKPNGSTEKDILEFVAEFSSWKTKYNDNNQINNSYILIYQNKVFSISGLFVTEIESYLAIGAGEDYALAALYLGHSPKEAVKVACDLCCYVAEPIIEIEKKKV